MRLRHIEDYKIGRDLSAMWRTVNVKIVEFPYPNPQLRKRRRYASQRACRKTPGKPKILVSIPHVERDFSLAAKLIPYDRTMALKGHADLRTTRRLSEND